MKIARFQHLGSACVRRFGLLGISVLISACGGGGGSSSSSADQGFVLGGTLAGLPRGGELLLLSGAGSQVTLTANGNFEFPGRLKAGTGFAVTVNRHPIAHTCTVSGDKGSMPSPGSDMRLLTVVCSANPYTLGGTTSGLRSGASVVLADGGRDGSSVTVSSNGPFSFPTRFAQGSTYSVNVQMQPAGQECRTVSATGTFAAASVSSVSVTCTPLTATVSGTVVGLASGQQVVLVNNGGDPLTVTADGKFQFAQSVDYASSFKVTVAAQPSTQTCSVSDGAVNNVMGSVSSVRVVCSARAYSIGGTVVGLSGLPDSPGLTLLNNGSDPIRLTGSGSFAFPQRQPIGADFAVSISAQPSGQLCTVLGGSGRVEAEDVRSISVQCVAGAWRSKRLAGSGVGRSTDGTGPGAEFAAPAGIALLPMGQILVAEISGSMIRRVNPNNSQVTTYSGGPLPGYLDSSNTRTAAYRSPRSIAVDREGNIYVADAGNHVIRRIDSFDGAVTTWAGSGLSGFQDGPGSAARFHNPQAVAIDQSGNVYVADAGNHVIRKIDASRQVTTLAGSAGLPGFLDGSAAAARFRAPSGVALDSAGQLYVSDGLNGAIRLVTLSGQVTTLAGNGVPGDADGSGSAARLSDPAGLFVDPQRVVYIADSGNHKIKMLQLINGVGLVQTIAGTGSPGDAEGESLSIGLRQPWGVLLTPSGELIVSEAGGHRLRVLSRVLAR